MRCAAVVMSMAVISAACATSSAESAPTESWGDRADALIAKAIAADTGQGGPLEYGMLTRALGARRGWWDSTTLHYFNKLRGLQHIDGGYGLTKPWDAGQDGTTNPATTAYTVSMAGHAGPALLEAHKAGVAEATRPLTRMIAKLVKIPYIPGVAPGACMAYSDHANDQKAGMCVHNVNAGAAAFLAEAHQAGIAGASTSWFWANATQQELVSYVSRNRNWPYSNSATSKMSDPAHLAYELESLMVLAPYFARNAITFALSSTPTSDWRWPLAHAWLARFDCARGEQWLDQFDIWTAGESRFALLAQAARVAATSSAVCDG